MKKFITIISVLLLAVCITACSPKNDKETTKNMELELAEGLVCSETYGGTISEESYATQEEALIAFVENEIKSAVTNAEYVGVDKEETLNVEDENIVNEFNLTDDQKEGLELIKKIIVKYKAMNVKKEEVVEKKKVFLLVINGQAFYLDPIPDVNDPISKSYFDSVLDISKYNNCTLTQVVDSVVHETIQGMKVDIIAKNSLVLKYDGNKLFQENIVTQTMRYVDLDDEDTTVTKSYMYIEENEGNFIVYTSNDNDYYSRSSVPLLMSNTGEPIDSLSDLLLFCNYDYSYLQKTETGFTFKKDYADKYLNDSYETALKNMAGATLNKTNSSSLDLYYYVSEGLLTKFVGDVKFDCNVTVSGTKVDVVSNTTTRCTLTDFGTTVVVNPTL